MEVISNYHWHNFIYGYELTDEELAEFDYIDSEELPTHNFIRYKGQIIDPSEYMQVNNDSQLLVKEFEGWHGYQSDTYFSGTMIKYSDDGEQYQIATYYS